MGKGVVPFNPHVARAQRKLQFANVTKATKWAGSTKRALRAKGFRRNNYTSPIPGRDRAARVGQVLKSEFRNRLNGTRLISGRVGRVAGKVYRNPAVRTVGRGLKAAYTFGGKTKFGKFANSTRGQWTGIGLSVVTGIHSQNSKVRAQKVGLELKLRQDKYGRPIKGSKPTNKLTRGPGAKLYKAGKIVNRVGNVVGLAGIINGPAALAGSGINVVGAGLMRAGVKRREAHVKAKAAKLKKQGVRPTVKAAKGAAPSTRAKQKGGLAKAAQVISRTKAARKVAGVGKRVARYTRSQAASIAAKARWSGKGRRKK